MHMKGIHVPFRTEAWCSIIGAHRRTGGVTVDSKLEPLNSSALDGQHGTIAVDAGNETGGISASRYSNKQPARSEMVSNEIIGHNFLLCLIPQGLPCSRYFHCQKSFEPRLPLDRLCQTQRKHSAAWSSRDDPFVRPASEGPRRLSPSASHSFA